jgi:hypothetical protein
MYLIRHILGFLAVLLPASFATTQAAELTWPDAVAEVAKWRTIAATCVRSFKQYGKEPDMAAGRLAYAQAKSDSDAVIAGLMIALSEGGKPASLSDLHARVEKSAAGLTDFCKMAGKLAPSTEGERGGLLEILSAITKPAIDKLTAAIATLYNDHQKDTAMRRETIRAQLDAARWPEFV